MATSVIAVMDSDMPSPGGCAVAEMQGFQTLISECQAEQGLFWRLTYLDENTNDVVEIDLSDQWIKLTNKTTEFKVGPDGIVVTGNLTVDNLEVNNSLKVGGVDVMQKITELTSTVSGMKSQINSLNSRVSALESAPPPAPKP